MIGLQQYLRFKQRGMLDKTSEAENPPSLHSMDVNQNCLSQNYLIIYPSTQILQKDFIKQQRSSPKPRMIRSYKPTSTGQSHLTISLMTKSSFLQGIFQQPSINPSSDLNGLDPSKLPTSFLKAKISHLTYQNSLTSNISPTPSTHHSSSHTYLTLMRTFQPEN